ncbi:hypothetical protein [Veillonella sp.]|jgi:hypothetical protein|uniref:hypothetical protein n=1 Tax=Veillonella sp. TaxID=1926307 RepID=UPI0028D8337B|nr:hypothetical protein [Veillonella sp.]MDU3434122.1 hypothetical protein [Veillonella sp.]MDU6205624.1 hypothetical protein [Veillonella sp.]
MRTLNKKVMTLACATCLTVGMGAVACADTVDLGYGMYGSTSPAVKAVDVMHVPTDAKLRNNEQSQMLFAANKEVVNTFNANLKWYSSVPVNPIKGEVLDGFSYYQLQGTNEQGHHTGYLFVIDYAKSGLDQTISMDKMVLEKGSEADKAKLKNSISKHVSVYSKENAQQQLASLPGDTVEGAKLAKAVKAINDSIPSHINNTFDKLLAADKKTSARDKEAISTFTGFMAKQLSVDATHVAYKPVQTRYGTAVTGDVRGALGFDGFRNSFALIGYAIPTDKGLSVQFLYSDDSSYDYWTNELNHMYQTQSLKGGK